MSLLTDLKNRRVFHAAAIYIAVAWGATQILIEIVDRLGMPQGLATITVILFVMGFPVAMFLSWVFDVTPKGIRRSEPGTAKGALSVILAFSFLIAGTGGLYYLLTARTLQQTLEGQALVLPPRSIAVLPFESGDLEASSNILAVGIVDELLSRFAAVPDLKVTGRASSFSEQLQGLDAKEIGLRLGVRKLLQGSVFSAGENIRVNASLIDTISGYQEWGDTVDIGYSENYAISAKLAERVVNALELNLTAETMERVSRIRRTDPRAYDLYLLGNQKLRDMVDDNSMLAVRYFEEALAIDPEFAAAHIGLSDALLSATLFMFIPPDQAIARAREATLTAIALDDELADAHLALNGLDFNHFWDWKSAGRAVRRSMSLTPGDVDTLVSYTYFLSLTGEHDSAIETMRRLTELDPITSDWQLQIGWLLNNAGRYEEALSQFEYVDGLMPDNPTLQMHSAWAYAYLGRREETVAAINRCLELAPDDILLTGGSAWLLAKVGEKERALELLEEFHRLAESGYADPITDAVVYLELGDKDRALEYVEQMINDRASSVVFLPQGHEFDALRADPRFHALVEESGLAPWSRLEVPP